MIMTVEWDDADCTILAVTLTGGWDVDEYRRGLDACKQKIQEVAHPVDLLVHVADKATMNPPGWGIRMGRNALLGAPMNTGILVIAPNSTTVLAFAEIAIHLLGSRYTGKLFTTKTVEDARQVILARR